MQRILVINGPNLNLLGTREPEIYGSTTLEDLEAGCLRWGAEVGAEVETYQSNHEGDVIDRLHAGREDCDGIVINPGALTHYSYALHDALEAVAPPAVEVHISNIEEREPWRQISVVRPACVYTVYGRGVDGYRWAIRHLFHRRQWPYATLSYGSDPSQVFDLRRPDAEPPFPVAVVVHGGFWRHQWTRDTTDGISVDLARRGIATANLEYRRVGKGGGWPASVEDVVRGIEAVLETPAVDRSRVVVIGHSAGAHLSLLAAHRLSDPVSMVVSLGGVTDMQAALAEGLGGGAAGDFLAGGEPEPASPIALLPVPSPVLVVHGTADDRVPVGQSERYADAAGCDRLIAAGEDHFGLIDPSSRTWQAVAARIVADLT